MAHPLTEMISPQRYSFCFSVSRENSIAKQNATIFTMSGFFWVKSDTKSLNI
jgi:hypothetical protein